MINNIIKITLILSFTFLLSCEDDINYRSDFEEEKILYCVIDMDADSQYVIVKKSFDDINSTEDNYISNAQISLTSNTKIVNLENMEGDGINLPSNYYLANNFDPPPAYDISIEAVLPDNSVLSSVISPPRFNLFFFEHPAIYIPYNEEEFEFSSYFRVQWRMNSLDESIAFLNFIFIDYSKIENGKEVFKRLEIPSEYIIQNNISVPIYTSVTKNNYQIFTKNSYEKALLDISEGDTNKANYKILGGTVELYILEENLASYFASAQTFKNSYSVKVYESILSNIEGGKGVFGAYYKRTLPVIIDPSYIRSFGYRMDPVLE